MLEYEKFFKACVTHDRHDLKLETKLFVVEKGLDTRNIREATVEEMVDKAMKVHLPFERSWWEFSDSSKNIFSIEITPKSSKNNRIVDQYISKNYPTGTQSQFTLVSKGLYVVDKPDQYGNEEKWFSFRANMSITIYDDQDNIVGEKDFADDFYEGRIYDNAEGKGMTVFCLGQVVSQAIRDNDKGEAKSGKEMLEEIEMNIKSAVVVTLTQIADKLYDASLAETTYKTKLKFKDPKTKKKGFYKINKVISIRSKTTKQPLSEFAQTYLRGDYTHGWWVRGHWRKCKTMGKDRNGNVTQKGRTWVVPHTKKDELGIVEKVRVL